MSTQIGRFGKQITAAVDDLTMVVDTAKQTRSLPMNKKLVQFNPRSEKDTYSQRQVALAISMYLGLKFLTRTIKILCCFITL